MNDLRRDIEFDAEGTLLRGWFYPAVGVHSTAPVIVMAHGLSAVKEMYLDDYADYFSAAGLNVLVFDHRNFGASEGSPRQEVMPNAQFGDYRHAITFAATLPEVDASQVGVWGTSFSGGHALMVGALDKRVSAVVAQVPFVSGFGNVRALVRADLLLYLQGEFARDRAARYAGATPSVMPVVDVDPMAASVLPSADSWQWFSETSAKRAPSWRNELTLKSVESLSEYEPQAYIHRISPVPLLVIIAEQDAVAPSELAFAAFERALEPKQLVVLPGGHFDAYVGDGFTRAASAALEHFIRHLTDTGKQ
jgi:hypothetical protein